MIAQAYKPTHGGFQTASPIQGTSRSIIQIAYDVADEFGVSRVDIISRKRTKRVAAARQRAMAIAKFSGFSVTEIARALGREHSAVSHAIKRERGR